MDEEIGCSEKNRVKNNSNDISVNLATLLKSLSQNSVGIIDKNLADGSDVNFEIENFERSVYRQKSDDNQYLKSTQLSSDSFLNQLTNSRMQNVEFSIGKSEKAYDSDVGKSVEEGKLLSKLSNTRFTSNVDALNSVHIQNMSALKSLIDNQNGHIYLLVKGEPLQTVDSGGSFANIIDSSSYSQSLQMSTSELDDDMQPSDSCSSLNNIGNSSLILAAHQLQLSSSLTTAEIIQKILESPQNNSVNSIVDSSIADQKSTEHTLPSFVSSYHRDSMPSSNINSRFYSCTVDNEPDVTLLVDEENSQSSSNFQKDKSSILLLNSSSLDLNNSGNGHDENVIKRHFKNQFCALLGDNNCQRNNLKNSVIKQTTAVESYRNANSSNTNNFMNGTTASKHQKRIKCKPAKNAELCCNSETISQFHGSPMSTTHTDELSKTCFGTSDNKELKRKTSHNEVERRRRDRINTWISQLQNMLPNSEKSILNRSKSHILKAVYDFFRNQTDQFAELKEKCEKLQSDVNEKNVIIKQLEDEKEVLLNQLQYINQAVTNSMKSTQESLNRNNIGVYRLNPGDKLKMNQSFRTASLYSDNSATISECYIVENQTKRRKSNKTTSD